MATALATGVLLVLALGVLAAAWWETRRGGRVTAERDEVEEELADALETIERRNRPLPDDRSYRDRMRAGIPPEDDGVRDREAGPGGAA